MTIVPANELTAEEVVKQSLKQSVQVLPEVTKEGGTNFMSLAGWRGAFLPAYGTREREFALRNWYRMDEQVLVRGAFSGLAKHIGNLPWEITGDDTPSEVFAGMSQELGYTGDTGVEYFQAILRHANFGAGWGQLMTQVVCDFLRYDTGAFIEVIGGGDSYGELTGAITGIAHLDPLRCLPTGDPRYPVIYYDRWGGLHVMHFTRIIQLQDMNDGDEFRPGYGDSALARAISIAARQMWQVRYINAYLDDEAAPGLDIIGGITKGMFDEVEAKFKMQQQMDSKPIWGKRMRFFTAGANVSPEIKSIQWQTAPEKFDFRVYTDIDVDTLALAMGIDRLDLMQLSGGGAIGSEGQSIIMHQKSKGKTIGFLITELERRFNDILPDGYTFGFKYRDEQEAKTEAEKANLWGDFVQKAKEFLTPAQVQILLASNIEAVHDAISNAPRVNDVDVPPERTPVVAADDTAGAEAVGSEAPEEMPSTDAKSIEKSYAVTQANFLQSLRALTKQAIEGEGVIGRYSFGIRMRNLLKDYGLRAYKDGMAQGGVFVDALDPEDESDYQKVFVDQAAYVGGFSDDLYVKKAITLNNLDARVNMWGKSLQSFVDSGQLTASANGMYEWKFGMTEHCPDCLRLNGQIHRMKNWYASGWLPRASTLSCKGFNCRCTLVKTNEKARGRF
jgi:hypothetical protein